MNRFYYFLFAFSLLIIGAILPSLYPILIYWISSDAYFTLNLISRDSWLVGYLYTGAAGVLLLIVACIFKPRFSSKSSIQFYQNKFMSYKRIIFWTALLSLSIEIVLNGLYGMSPSNIVPQRPMVAVYFGYIARILGYSIALYVLTQIYFYGKLDKRGLLILVLFLVYAASSSSRSGLIVVIFLTITGLAYSPIISKIKLSMFAIIILLGLSSAIIGDLLRGGGDLLEPLANILLRFFANNQALFLAVEDQEKIRSILLYNQPTVMLDQMFSFLVERTEYPSSFRLLEYWGGKMGEAESGHIAGYAYGWLGLTYGTLGWYGLCFVTAILFFYFFILRGLFSRPSFPNLTLSMYFSGMLLEFFTNLGLDSYVEKMFKGFIAVLVYILIIEVIAKAKIKPILQSPVHEARV